MAFTYSLSTDSGRVRLLSTDANPNDYVFDDAEIEAFLDLSGGDIWEAAALAVETYARNRMRLSAEIRDSTGAALKRRTPQELLSLAQSIREARLKQSLQTGRITVSTDGELLDGFRPLWRDVDDETVE